MKIPCPAQAVSGCSHRLPGCSRGFILVSRREAFQNEGPLNGKWVQGRERRLPNAQQFSFVSMSTRIWCLLKPPLTAPKGQFFKAVAPPTPTCAFCCRWCCLSASALESMQAV